MNSAKRELQELRHPRAASTFVLIGSQLVNYATEIYVADLFGCVPFRAQVQEPTVPFFMAFRQNIHNLTSCFGGYQLPGIDNTDGVGLYYRDNDKQWHLIEFIYDEQDAGIVISGYNPSTQCIQLVLFGYSGRGTDAIGRVFARDPDRFWPVISDDAGRQAEDSKPSTGMLIQIHVCQVMFVKGGATAPDGLPTIKDCKIVQSYRV